MIPKIIHYCWFGGKPIPEEYLFYIDTWQRYLPNYVIKRWDETNYDVNCIPFSAEAYSDGKYAYVSDYARLRILYDYGGVYFDTDVEVIQSLDAIMERGSWMGVEKHTSSPDIDDMVALGLGVAVEPQNSIINEIMQFYENHHYIYPDGHKEQIPIVPITTDVLRKHGLPNQIEIPTNVDGITIYPWDYFCPQEFLSRKVEITEHTYTIHHYSATWMSCWDKMKMRKGFLGRRVRKILKRFF